ncbi:hypothetical protein AB838_06915 [Rhodobacteraceae bacterium (ex Bugula neritina AB1)]|nr:hypothetical protein AB838_06915 [Rhodobacteraceae bacterium (ex Bugula neritina AB1)]
MAHRGKLFHSVQDRFRGRRFKAFKGLLDEALEHKDRVRILDVGGSPTYWNMLDPSYDDKVEIHCLNFEGEFTKYDGLRKTIQLENVVGDGCDMSQYEDGAFDIAHSNSVIEHVGSLQNMGKFAAETRRVGRAYYMQTPNFWFPIEPHYMFPLIHWLPDAAKIALFTNVSLGYAKKVSFETALVRIDHTRMLSTRMMRQFYPDATIHFERLILRKSITAIRRLSD